MIQGLHITAEIAKIAGITSTRNLLLGIVGTTGITKIAGIRIAGAARITKCFGVGTAWAAGIGTVGIGAK